MVFVRLAASSLGGYTYRNGSNIAMDVLGCFFATDIGCNNGVFFREWALESTDGDVCGGNCTVLEKENDNILLSDECSEELIPTKLKMSTNQFIQLCDEWQEKIVKLMPKEVIIKHEHGRFFIETSD